MKGLFSQARSAEGAERARAEREACCMFQLIVNADTKFACKIIVLFSEFLFSFTCPRSYRLVSIMDVDNKIACKISHIFLIFSDMFSS